MHASAKSPNEKFCERQKTKHKCGVCSNKFYNEWLHSDTPKSSCNTVCVIKGCHLLDLGSFDLFKD